MQVRSVDFLSDTSSSWSSSHVIAASHTHFTGFTTQHVLAQYICASEYLSVKCAELSVSPAWPNPGCNDRLDEINLPVRSTGVAGRH